MNFLDLRTTIQTRLVDPRGVKFTHDILKVWVNEAYVDWACYTKEVINRFQLTGTIVNTELFDIDPLMLDIYRVEVDGLKIPTISIQELDNIDPDWKSADAADDDEITESVYGVSGRRWYKQYTKWGFYPKIKTAPTTAVYLWCPKRPDDMTADGESPLIKTENHKYIVWYCMAIGMSADRIFDEKTSWAALYMRAREEAKQVMEDELQFGGGIIHKVGPTENRTANESY